MNLARIDTRRRPARQTLTERPVQRGAIRLLATAGFEAVHVPNGSHLAGNAIARAKQMAALKADGLRIGFPDLLVLGKSEGQIGFLECKREKGGVMSTEQLGWRDRLQGLGWPWHLVCVPEDALVALRVWGWRS